MAKALPGSVRRRSLLNDPAVRGLAYQLLLVAALLALAYGAASNVVENLRQARIASGFGFLWQNSGFDVNQTLIPYNSTTGTYGRAFLVGLLNTLLVAAVGVVLTTMLGFALGLARLSTNWVVSGLARVYVEVVRNVPLLLQLLFWYNAVLKALPGPRQSFVLGGGAFLNNRGLFVPAPALDPALWPIPLALVAGLAAAIVFARWSRRRREATGRRLPSGGIAVALAFGPAVLAFIAVGRPIAFDEPILKGFNFVGGLQVLPEFVALILGLVIYTAAFIGEIVRAGVTAVSHGQVEAAQALGLRAGPTLRLVIIPQAMRVIIPPLTSQYLNLIKNSSLAVAIGYPDLVQIFAGTVLNQTGQAVEIIAMTMAVYLVVSLVVSFAMNLYNRRMAIVER